MLVLSRKPGGEIHIGTKEQFQESKETIVKVYLSDDGKLIMVGIEAEPEQRVLRSEIVEKTLAEWFP